jgi:hypothetical protein
VIAPAILTHVTYLAFVGKQAFSDLINPLFRENPTAPVTQLQKLFPTQTHKLSSARRMLAYQTQQAF